jgi:hypothetical protein
MRVRVSACARGYVDVPGAGDFVILLLGEEK